MNSLNLSPEKFHAENIKGLAFHIHSTHINLAFKTHQCRSRRCGYAMLTGARLSHDTFLTHALSQQNLPKNIVDFVRTRVIEIFTFQNQSDT